VGATILALAMPAQAHVPVLLDSHDVLPWNGPLVVDGSAGVALFGTLHSRLSIRSAQLKLTAGQQISVTVGIPNKAPENALPATSLPLVIVISPDGQITTLDAQMRVPVHNPDFNQDYLFIRNYVAPAITGTYSLVVVGQAPERFVVATGFESAVEAVIKRGQPATDEQLEEWYTTAP